MPRPARARPSFPRRRRPTECHPFKQPSIQHLDFRYSYKSGVRSMSQENPALCFSWHNRAFCILGFGCQLCVCSIHTSRPLQIVMHIIHTECRPFMAQPSIQHSDFRFQTVTAYHTYNIHTHTYIHTCAVRRTCVWGKSDHFFRPTPSNSGFRYTHAPVGGRQIERTTHVLHRACTPSVHIHTGVRNKR